MKTFSKQLVVNIKMTYRNKQALFWRLFFPIIFITIFGLFNMDSFVSSKMVVVDKTDSEISHKIIEGFEKVEFIKIEKESNLDTAKQKLKESEADFVIVMPESIRDIQTEFKPKITIDPKTKQPVIEVPKAPDPITLDVFYNESNVSSNQLVLNVLTQITTQINAVANGTPKLFDIHSEALTNRKIRYIDFLVPGILAMSIMQSAIIGVAVYLTEFREKKILKRVFATPVSRTSFVGAQVVAWILMSLIQSTLIILTGKLMYDINIYGNYWYILVWVLLGNIVFINIGFIIASFSKTVAAAEGLSQVVSMPMMFLSGVFFSTESLHKTIKAIVDYLPLSPIIEALREIMLNARDLTFTTRQLQFIGSWIVITFIIAVLRFRLVRE